MSIEFKAPPAAEVVRLCRFPHHELAAIRETNPTIHQFTRTGKENAHARS